LVTVLFFTSSSLPFGVSPQTPPTFLKKGWTKNFGKNGLRFCPRLNLPTAFSPPGEKAYPKTALFGILGKENNADTIF